MRRSTIASGSRSAARIEAEDYRVGGEGVGYHDSSPGNSGGQYRTDDVDIETCPEGGYCIMNWSSGEWLAYDVHVPETGLYDMTFRVASESPDRHFYVTVDDVNVTGFANSANDGI